MTNKKLNLLGLDRQTLGNWLAPEGVNSAQVARLVQAIHRHRVVDFSTLDCLTRRVRERLIEETIITPLPIVREELATDGVIKWLFGLPDDNAIEAVYIPEEKRATLCISSQIGCSLNCSFCATARQGFNRHLLSSEIVGQVYTAIGQLQTLGRLPMISNIVFMGMGEPLLNLDAVIPALDLLLDDWAYGLAKRRVTVSTAGVVPGMDRLREASSVALAVSLHAPTNSLRDVLVPLNKKYPLELLMDACRRYYQGEKRTITFEYVMLDGVNDHASHATQLLDLLAGIPAKINLIPFNPFPQVEFRTSPTSVITDFQRILLDGGFVTTIRKTRGEKIAAACGQLAGKVNSLAKRQHHIAKKLRNIPIVQLA